MHSTRWATGIGRCHEACTAITVCVVAHDQIAGQEINFFPVIMDKGCGRVFARCETEEACAASGLARLIEVAGQDLLLDSRGITRRRSPTFVEVDREKFEMRLGHDAP